MNSYKSTFKNIDIILNRTRAKKGNLIIKKNKDNSIYFYLTFDTNHNIFGNGKIYDVKKPASKFKWDDKTNTLQFRFKTKEYEQELKTKVKLVPVDINVKIKFNSGFKKISEIFK